MASLTKTEHRILQIFLNLGNPVTSDLIMLAILNGRKKLIRSHAGAYVHHLRKKLAAEGIFIDSIKAGKVGYILRRTKPIRDRAEYMRSYRNRGSLQIGA